MSFEGLNLDDYQEPTVLDADKEYELKIVNLEAKISEKTGSPFYLARLEAPDFATSKDITHVMMCPSDGDTPKQANSRGWNIGVFVRAFEIPQSPALKSEENPFGLDCEAAIGQTGFAILGTEDSPGFGMQNRIKKCVPRR